MSTILSFVPSREHSRSGHPEHAGRLAAVQDLLQHRGLLDFVDLLEPEPAMTAQLQQVHSEKVVERVYQASLLGGRMLDGDTYTTADSYRLARLAAGACSGAVNEIFQGRATNGFALVRPPGHHAERLRSGGFCLFNNVALAAREAQRAHGVERVLVVDFDVHHGNGTQDIFYDDPSVLFVSSHLFGSFFYPGTGAAREIGSGAGLGTTLNIPLPPLVGDVGYRRIFDELIRPRVDAFRPQFILVSAGYDAHWRDPLAHAGLSLTGYVTLVHALLELANRHCGGRILFVLEGGYFLDALSYGVLNTVYALLGLDQLEDPLGPLPQAEADVGELLALLQQLHLI